MPDRENVIKAVECRKNAHKRCGNPCEQIWACKYAAWVRSPDGEPYYPCYCDVERLCDDVLTLLREQDPRVLTLEEAKTYEVVWLEDKGEGELHPLIVQNNMNNSKYYKYGIHWRVWSAKPTDEQRKAVKWE